jgi:hypothetical protein
VYLAQLINFWVSPVSLYAFMVYKGQIKGTFIFQQKLVAVYYKVLFLLFGVFKQLRVLLSDIMIYDIFVNCNWVATRWQ